MVPATGGPLIVRSRGLIIGKFWPPHLGHHRIIDELSRQCDELFIVVCGAPGQTPRAIDRSIWIQAVHPHAEVLTTADLCADHHPDPCADECSATWARRVEELGVAPVDVVATAESYGSAFAAAVGARLLEVDRSIDGISATAIRADLGTRWADLHPVVRRGIHRRVVVLGAESTGTTTLAHDLSTTLGIPCTAEAGRTWSWYLYSDTAEMSDVHWSDADFWSIVGHQMALEDSCVLAHLDDRPGQLGPWMVADTDTLATVAWWERYLTTDSRPLHDFALSRLGDLYLLTSPDGIAFDGTDPLRDGESIRLAMHDRFMELLQDSGAPFVVVRGSRTERLAAAVEAMALHEANHPRWRHRV